MILRKIKPLKEILKEKHLAPASGNYVFNSYTPEVIYFAMPDMAKYCGNYYMFVKSTENQNWLAANGWEWKKEWLEPPTELESILYE